MLYEFLSKIPFYPVGSLWLFCLRLANWMIILRVYPTCLLSMRRKTMVIGDVFTGSSPVTRVHFQ